MDQRIKCPGCGTSYPFNKKLLGKRVKCKKCQNVFSASRSPSSTDVQPGAFPALADLPKDSPLDDLMGESLPPVENLAPQSSGQQSPLSAGSTARNTVRRKAGPFKMTKMESSAFSYGLVVFVVGILLMFGIRLRGRGGRIRDRLSGEGPAPAGPTLQFIGLLMAVTAVGAIGFALRRRLHFALPACGGMLVVLGISYLYSPLHRYSVAMAARSASPPTTQSPMSTAPGNPEVPRMTEESEAGEPRTLSGLSDTIRRKNPPAAVDPFQELDLLKELDLQRDSVAGQWTVNQSAIESDGGRSILAFPVKPSGDYRWTVVLERVVGSGGINLVVTVGSHQTMIVLQGFREKQASGLNRLAGRTADNNETTWQGPIFASRKPTTVVCTVRGPTINVICDGREIINWSGSEADLSLDLRYWANVPKGRLAVAIYDSDVLWRVLESRLEPLGKD